jgi:outer membrane immunogenic protein
MTRTTSVALATAAVFFATTSMSFAADLPTKGPMYTKAPVMAPMHNWSGFYLGLNAGYSWGHQDNDLIVTATGASVFSNSDRLDGFIGGGQIGYNWQVNQWVFGVEADFQGSGQKADGSYLLAPIAGAAVIPGLTASYTDKLEWFGTVRGRIGLALGSRGEWLPYVTGGWAYGHGTLSGTGTTTPAGTVAAFSASEDYSGWTIGGGIEWAFDDHWSAKAEYLYIDFGDGPTVAANAAGTLSIASGKLTDNIARLGVNYKF